AAPVHGAGASLARTHDPCRRVKGRPFLTYRRVPASNLSRGRNTMITLMNPPGINTSWVLQKHTPNPPLGLAYVAAAIREVGFPYQVVDGTGEALDVVRPYPDRDDFMIQWLSFEEITARVHPDTTVHGVPCMFSTLWPLVNKLAWAVRGQFP